MFTTKDIFNNVHGLNEKYSLTGLKFYPLEENNTIYYSGNTKNVFDENLLNILSKSSYAGHHVRKLPKISTKIFEKVNTLQQDFSTVDGLSFRVGIHPLDEMPVIKVKNAELEPSDQILNMLSKGEFGGIPITRDIQNDVQYEL